MRSLFKTTAAHIADETVFEVYQAHLAPNVLCRYSIPSCL